MAEASIVKPRPISGFPEWLPAEKLLEERLLAIIREEFERFGFTPIETPAVERQEVLSAKGVLDKEIYALSRLAAGEGEDPATDLALHFDLTVPLARYVAQHFARLTFPFRRYQIQKVWRGERPQAGRFREFYQCDIDVVGNGSLSPLADAELPLVIHGIFTRIGIGPFVIRLNNRKVLQGFLEHLGVPPEGRGAALRAVDELDKVGVEAVRAGLVEHAGLDDRAAGRLLDFVGGPGDLAAWRALEAGPLFARGVAELTELVEAMAALGLPDQAWRLDPSIARGLDYYTGTVYETVLVERPEIGSICSGGRYDDLAGSYIRQSLPGVGVSIGLTRLLARLLEAGLLKPGAATPARVLVTVMDRRRLGAALAMAAELRAAGIPTELFTEEKKLGQQLKHADAKGFAAAIIAGEEEIEQGLVQVKTLATGEQAPHPRDGLVAAVRALLER